MSRPSWDDTYIEMAVAASKRGTCLRRKVGVVLVDADHKFLASGHNGRPAGWPHCNHEEVIKPQPNSCESCGWGKCILSPAPRHCTVWVPRGVESVRITHPHACPGATAASGTQLDECDAIHAEQNALMQCSDVSRIHTCYTTTAPCVHCVKMLLNTACRRIVFIDDYPGRAKELWAKAGREWVKHTPGGDRVTLQEGYIDVSTQGGLSPNV